MNIFRAQTLSLYLLVLSALGTVFTADTFEWPLVSGLVVAVCASLLVPYRLRERWSQSKIVALGLVLMLLSVVVEVVWGPRDVVSGATLFLVLVLISRLYTPRKSSDAIQVLTLSFVVVLAGSAMNTSLAFAPYFILVIVCSIWALTTTHLTKAAEMRPEVAREVVISRRFWVTTSALAIAVFAQTTVFFVVFPRMGLGYFKPKVRTQQASAGFSDRVELGQQGTLQDDNTVVLRVEFPEGFGDVDAEQLYFRGATLGRFDGRRWTKSLRGQVGLPQRADRTFAVRPSRAQAPGAAPAVLYRLYQEPTESEYVFFPEVTERARFIGDNPIWSGKPRVRFYGDGTGDVVGLRPVGVALSLEGWVSPTAKGLEADVLDEHRAVPAMDKRILDQAEAWTRGVSGAKAIARALHEGLADGFTYSTEMVAPPEGQSPIAYFLFDRKAGHCEYFASAMALMLRARGVPSRLVAGYRGASFNEYGGYWTVAEYRAHSWVEYFDDADGWTRIDPTPSVAARPSAFAFLEQASAFADVMRYRWNRYIVEFDLDLQIDAMRAIQKAAKGDPKAPSTGGGVGKWLTESRVRTVALSAALVALCVAWVLWRRRYVRVAARDSEATKLFRAFEKTAESRGLGGRAPTQAPAAYFDALAEANPHLRGAIGGFGAAYLRARYSAAAAPNDLAEMRAALRVVEQAQRRPRAA